MADVRYRVAYKRISTTGPVDLTVTGFASASRIKGLRIWSAKHPKGLALANGQFASYYANSLSTGLSGNGGLMGQTMVMENAETADATHKNTDAGGNSDSLGNFFLNSETPDSASDRWDFEANTSFILVPEIGGVQVSGPIDNGWRINVTELSTPFVDVYYSLWAGNDIECRAFSAPIDNVASNFQVSNHQLTNPVKVLGFAHTTGRETPGQTYESGIRNGFGAFYWDGTSITQAGAFTRQAHTTAWDASDTFSARSIVHYLQSATDWEVRVSDLDATTITLETVAAPGPDSVGGSTADERCGLFLVSLPAESTAWVGTFTLPSGGSDFKIPDGPDFTPLGMGVLATPLKNFDLELTNAAEAGCWSYGELDDKLNQGCASFICYGNTDSDDSTASSINIDALVYSYYHAAEGGDISSPTLMSNITITESPFLSGGGIEFKAADVSGSFGGLAWAWAIKDGKPAEEERPFITGRTLVGGELAVDTTCIDGLVGVGTFAYQWYRDGLEIEGATDSEYTTTEDDVGAEITVEVTYVDLGGEEITLETDATPAIHERTRKPLATPQDDEERHPAMAQWMSRVSDVANAIESSGGAASRPVQNLYPGRFHYDTSLGEKGKPIWYAAGKWWDAEGEEV